MPAKKKHKVILIAGPTAVGKTSAAIQVAQYFHASIISADSRQCYREMNIGVARPSPQELASVPHYFIASHSMHDEVNAATFEQFALQKATELFQSNEVVIMTGGTGLYIKAFCEGLDMIPAIEPSVRKKIVEAYNEKGLNWLQTEVSVKDPLFYKTAEQQNPNRLMRALEVIEGTGQSITSFQKSSVIERDFEIVKIGLELPREELYKRIELRVDQMIQAGQLDEVRSLLAFRELNALQTVGYSELFDFLEDKISLDQATALIKQHTRNYAKRQLTWFKKDSSYTWTNPNSIMEICTRLT